MKVILLVLLLSPCAYAASNISYNSAKCTPAAATSCTLSASPPPGSLMVSFAYRSNSATAPGTAAGWTVIRNTSGNTNDLKIGYKYAVGNETNCGTWSNATQTDCHVYTGFDMASTFSIGANTSGSTGSSTSISYPTFTLSVTGGSSWVVCAAGGASATNVDAAPTGMTLRSGTTLNNIAFSDTNGGVTSWSTTAVTVSPTGVWASACFEILSNNQSMSTISPYLVRNVYYAQSGEACTGACNLVLPLNFQTSANNFLSLTLYWGYVTTAPTISNIYCNSDSGHATWTWTAFAHPVLDTANTTDATIYNIDGATSGCTQITVVFSSVFSNVLAHFMEWRQIATSSAIDTSAGANPATSTVFSPGSMTSTVGSDLWYVTCAPDANNLGNYTSGFVATPSGAFSLAADTTHTYGAMAFIQGSSGAYTPNITFQGFGGGSGLSGICMGMALKTSAGAGTAPTGVQMVQQLDYTATAGGTVNLEISPVTVGNTMLVIGNSSQSAAQWTSISDSLGSSFTTKGTADYSYFGYDCNLANVGLDNVALAGTATGIGNYVVTEWTSQNNSSHTSCINTSLPTSGYATATGTAPTITNAPSLSSLTANGTVVAQIAYGTGAAGAITSPTGGVYLYPTYTGMTDASQMTEGGGFAIWANAASTSGSFTWTGPTTSSWNAAAIQLVPSTSPNIPPLWVIQP